MMNSKYMRYSVDVDRYLINRPHEMIRHCLLQKGLGKKLDHTGIKFVGVGKFTIEYFQGNFLKRHSVDFGGDEAMPKCSCFTWRKSAYPCKYFFCNFLKISCLELDCSFETVPPFSLPDS